MEFGHAVNSKLLTDNSQSTALWLLNKVIDKNGNYSLFSYSINTTARSYALSEIYYTGNEKQGLLPYNAVHLTYNVRNNSQTNTIYDRGASFSNPYNLDKITITNEAGAIVKTYQCAYNLVKNEYFLASVQEFGSDGTSLNPTVFKYGANTVADNVTISPSIDNLLPGETYSGDFYGDGKQDVLTATISYDNDGLQHNSGYNILGITPYNPIPSLVYYCRYEQPASEAPVEVMGTKNGFYNFLTYDYDGDGRSDILMTKTQLVTNGSTKDTVYNGIRVNYSRVFSSSSGLFYDSVNYDAIPKVITYAQPFKYIYSNNSYFIPGDFNGDGFRDYILVLGINPKNSFKAFFSSPKKGIFNEEILNFGVEGASGDFYATSVASARSLIPIDFNGDGKTEILVVKDNQSYVLSVFMTPATSGYLYGANVLTATAAIKSDYPVYPGDFNGDRKTDLLVRSSASNPYGSPAAAWNILYSTGKAFNITSFQFTRRPYLPSDANNTYGITSAHNIMVGDFNNDGKTDIWHSLDESYQVSYHVVYYSNGLSFTNETYSKSESINSDLISYPVSGDYNGDGKTDMLTLRDGNGRFILAKPFKEERLLTTITNGLGADINFGYNLLTNSNIYTRSSAYTYNVLNTPIFEGKNGNPYSVFTSPLYVLTSQNVPNGIGGTASISYTYQDAVMHRKGRGFLGFKKYNAYDGTSGNTATTENEINTTFSIPFPVTQYTVNGSVKISENRFTYSFAALSSSYFDRRYTQHLDKVLSINGLTDAATESINTYDNYGNITNNVKNIGSWDGAALTTIETETNATTYGAHNTPVPALPDYFTAKRVRPTHEEVVKKTEYLYSPIGNVTTKKEYAGLTIASESNYNYDLFGNVLSTTVTGYGTSMLSTRTSSTTYDAQGRFALQRDQLDADHETFKREKFIYDTKWGKPLTYIASNGLTTRYQYDGFGRLTKTAMPEGYDITQTLNWENTNGVYSLINNQPGGGANTKIWYDILGREVLRQTSGFNGQWLTQNTGYDSKGNVISQTKSYYSGETPVTTTTQYDQYNRVTQVSNTTSTNTYSYSKLSGGLFKATTTNGAGQSSSKTQDAAGRIKTTNDNGGLLSYTYDSWGNQLTVVNGSNTLVKNRYDIYGRQTSLEDKNAGLTTYQYDGFGQLVGQTDAINNSYTISYDGLGRMISRTGPEGTTTYEYDYSYDVNTAITKNNLIKVTGFGGEVTEYTYDYLNRMQTQTTTVDGVRYTKQLAYDTYGNLIKTTYPSGVIINDTYDRNATLTQTTLTDGGTTTTLFTANAINSAGVYTDYSYGNGKTSQVTYNSALGVPARYYTPGVQDLNFDFNAQTGNLNFREDAIKNHTETFTYDNLNRLKGSSVNNVQQFAINYDGTSGNSKGNIVSKTDAGNYVYKTDKINAVAYVTNPAGAQALPAVISTNPQQITYTPFQKTASIDQNGYRLDYTYAADMERIKSVLKQNGAIVETKYYFGAMEMQTKGGATRYIHYINAGNGLCAIAVKENGITKVYYAYNDYLGSILTLTDNTGAIAAKQNFDAWGRYRNPDDWTYNNIPVQPVWLYRGFTGHEHLKELALINMNGRMYDPVLGRILSPDNEVPLPWNTQGYNKYSYANNNPLVYVDPDGNFFFAPIIVGSIVGAFLGGIDAVNQGGSFLSGALKGAFIGGIGGGISGALSGAFTSWGMVGSGIANGAITGFVSGGLTAAFNGTNFFNGALNGALSGGVIGGVTGFFERLSISNEAYDIPAERTTYNGDFYASNDELHDYINKEIGNNTESSLHTNVSLATPNNIDIGEGYSMQGKLLYHNGYKIGGYTKEANKWYDGWFNSLKSRILIAPGLKGLFSNGVNLAQMSISHELIHAYHISIGLSFNAKSEASASAYSLNYAKQNNLTNLIPIYRGKLIDYDDAYSWRNVIRKFNFNFGIR